MRWAHRLLKIAAGYVVELPPTPCSVELCLCRAYNASFSRLTNLASNSSVGRHDVLPWINVEQPSAPHPCAKCVTKDHEEPCVQHGQRQHKVGEVNTCILWKNNLLLDRCRRLSERCVIMMTSKLVCARCVAACIRCTQTNVKHCLPAHLRSIFDD